MKTIKAGLAALASALLLNIPGQAATNLVTSASMVAGTNYWRATNQYLLTEMVFVEAGEVLVIEPGTVIKGQTLPGLSGTAVPSLVVARGGKIYAEGRADAPIIFTAENDDVNDPHDLGIYDRGLWGGVVLLGRAVINSAKDSAGNLATPKYDVFEGLPDIENLRYGGADDEDSSGVLRYVSIRHGGTSLEVNKEINGLTLGGVGRGTVVEHVEVYANDDDGVEFFGGAVNTKWLVSAFCDDDAFDTDEGYRGTNQFWFAIQAPTGNRNFGGEYAGSPVSPFNYLPLSDFRVYNATYLGAGAGNLVAKENTGFDVKEDSAAKHYNSIFTDFANRGIKIQNNALTRAQAGDIVFQNNLWWGFGTTANPNSVTNIAALNSEFLFTTPGYSNRIENPLLRGISRTNNLGLDPRPQVGSPALTGVFPAGGGVVTPVDYLGAFDPYSGLWIDGWTALSHYGFLSTNAVSPKFQLAVGAGNINLGFGTTLGKTYQLQSSGDLKTWANEGAPFVGDGQPMLFQAPINYQTNRYYRLIVP